MIYKIKILLIIVIVFLITSFFFNYRSPMHLSHSFNRLLTQGKFKINQFLTKNSEKKIDKLNTNLYQIVKPIIKSTNANEKITIYYKGKKLTIISDIPSPNFDEQDLEFFYKLEILREKNKVINQRE